MAATLSFAVDDEVLVSINASAYAHDLAYITAQTAFGILPTLLTCMSKPSHSAPVGVARVLGGACGLIAYGFADQSKRVSGSLVALEDLGDGNGLCSPTVEATTLGEEVGTGLSMHSLGFGLNNS